MLIKKSLSHTFGTKRRNEVQEVPPSFAVIYVCNFIFARVDEAD